MDLVKAELGLWQYVNPWVLCMLYWFLLNHNYVLLCQKFGGGEMIQNQKQQQMNILAPQTNIGLRGKIGQWGLEEAGLNKV